MTEINKIFVDMDGVLADFERGIELPMFLNGPFTNKDDYDSRKKELSDKGLFAALPPMPGMELLVNHLKNTGIHWEILTASGAINRSVVVRDKITWVNKYIHPKPILTATIKGADKAVYARPSHVLIDDRKSNIDAWTGAGGIGIIHTTAKSTIEQLESLGISSVAQKTA